MRTYILAAALLVAASGALADDCALSTASACQTANTLLWAKDFKPALRAFAGKKKVTWLGRATPLWEVVNEAMSGVPDDRAETAPGVYRFSASRYQSAMERGAVVVEKGKIRAAGVLHFNCGKQGCDKAYTLSVILRNKDDAAAGWIEAWGREQMTLNAESGGYSAGETAISRTEVIMTGK
ncbi:hypothetical protein [Rhizobium sp. TRM95796]|uniref:hypothetical protein n=1 Tax=Rhizobium sp. TRM95796 TaxID=2979862 RepID=UPI0021E89E62|nr:hypothetical protein [Rhizobium sp. TRM95796]MCV3765071.1 hypothetical protein [Rhizobium sp. TRM95796]